MTKTLEQRIERLKTFSNCSALKEDEYYDIDDVKDIAWHNGAIETAKEALSIIQELQQENERLRDALRGIERCCDGNNPAYEHIWRIAYSLINPDDKLEDKDLTLKQKQDILNQIDDIKKNGSKNFMSLEEFEKEV